jgi:hypothetical protein
VGVNGFHCLGIVFPRKSVSQILIFTLATSYCVEFCKLYQTPWLHDFRNSTIGHLLLGSTFSWQNLIAYTIGAAIGALVERALFFFGAKADILVCGTVPRPNDTTL